MQAYVILLYARLIVRVALSKYQRTRKYNEMLQNNQRHAGASQGLLVTRL